MKMIAFYIVLVVLVAVLLPYAVIWAINTIFNTTIPFTFWTWLAMLILLIVTRSEGGRRNEQ